MKASEVTEDMIGKEVWVKGIVKQVDDSSHPVFIGESVGWIDAKAEVLFTEHKPSKREIVEISQTAVGDNVSIIAKANDNTVWIFDEEKLCWQRFPDLPQDGLETEGE